MIHMQKAEKPEIEKNSPHITKEELDRAFDERFPVWMKEKLQKASVAVAGLGGLGSNIAVSLARSGVGHLLLVDWNSLLAGLSCARPLTGRTRKPCWSALFFHSARIPSWSPETAWRVWGTQTTSGHSRSSEGSMSAGTIRRRAHPVRDSWLPVSPSAQGTRQTKSCS